jgi:hypothetical protein
MMMFLIFIIIFVSIKPSFTIMLPKEGL